MEDGRVQKRGEPAGSGHDSRERLQEICLVVDLTGQAWRELIGCERDSTGLGRVYGAVKPEYRYYFKILIPFPWLNISK